MVGGEGLAAPGPGELEVPSADQWGGVDWYINFLPEQRSLLSLAAKKDKVFQGDKGKYKPSKRTYHPRRASVDWETERE